MNCELWRDHGEKIFVYGAIFTCAIICGCSLDPIGDAYVGEKCADLKKIITRVDYDGSSGVYDEVYCEGRGGDGAGCDAYVRHNHINGETSSNNIDSDMIYAFESGICPNSYECKSDSDGENVCIKSLCNGKLVSLDTDDSNCGACGRACQDGTFCLDGECIAATCSAGQVLCGSQCIDPLTDNAYCGASGDCEDVNAGEACASGMVCSGGKCGESCLSGQVLCGGKCVDPLTDNAYCGASGDCKGDEAGQRCKDGEVCSDGTCVMSCVEGQVICSGKCIDTQTDNLNCGRCGNKCSIGSSCFNSNCACPDGQIVCEGKCIDPKTNENYCGASGSCTEGNIGKRCEVGQACVDGFCIQHSCPEGKTLCSTSEGNRCFNLFGNDIMNCGACRFKCIMYTPIYATSEGCVDGVCIYKCSPNSVNMGNGNTLWSILCVDCSRVGKTKCGNECVDTQTDSKHCGRCGNACKSGESCSKGTCVISG